MDYYVTLHILEYAFKNNCFLTNNILFSFSQIRTVTNKSSGEKKLQARLIIRKN